MMTKKMKSQQKKGKSKEKQTKKDKKKNAKEESSDSEDSKEERSKGKEKSNKNKTEKSPEKTEKKLEPLNIKSKNPTNSGPNTSSQTQQNNNNNFWAEFPSTTNATKINEESDLSSFTFVTEENIQPEIKHTETKTKSTQKQETPSFPCIDFTMTNNNPTATQPNREESQPKIETKKETNSYNLLNEKLSSAYGSSDHSTKLEQAFTNFSMNPQQKVPLNTHNNNNNSNVMNLHQLNMFEVSNNMYLMNPMLFEQMQRQIYQNNMNNYTQQMNQMTGKVPNQINDVNFNMMNQPNPKQEESKQDLFQDIYNKQKHQNGYQGNNWK